MMNNQLLTRDQILGLLTTLRDYLIHPLQKIKDLPNWSWQELIVAQVLATGVSGALTGLVSRSFLGLLGGLLLTPILTMITITLCSLFFYYLFQIFAGNTLNFRRLMTVVFFANLPFFLFQIISSLVPPISLVGLAFSTLILIVGLVENFGLPRKLVTRTLVALYIVIFLVWIWGRWDSLQIESKYSNSREQAPAVRLGE